MQTQTFTQTITILVGDATIGSLADTGVSLADTGMNLAFILAIALGLILFSLAILMLSRRGHLRTFRSNFRGFRGLGIFTFLALGLASLAFGLPTAMAAPTLTIDSSASNINITVPKGGGTTTTTTTISTSTASTDGYTLTAALAAAEPGIGISLSGGNITTTTPLVAAASPLTVHTTDAANTANPDTTAVQLTFTIDGTVTEGKKELKLAYTATDNPAVTPLAPTTMQSMTSDYCTNQMSIYTGTNEEAILNLLDPRGNTEAEHQTYQVAKLADGNCWMLDNLKLGSTTATTTLTTADTNIDQTKSPFTLPQLVTTGTADFDIPGVYGPVPDDTGTGATNYGYLYNWSAATAGETHATMPGDGTDDDVAPHSICPANWRLPTGGETGEFAMLNAKMNDPSASGPSTADGSGYYQNWQHDGPFKGALAGYWWDSFYGQGSWTGLWSASAYPGDPHYAFYADFNAGGVYPGGVSGRDGGFSVRCLLN